MCGERYKVPSERTYSRQTRKVAELLGKRIQLARKARKMSETQLAERCGMSRATIRAIERGSLQVEVGLFFEAAYIVGVQLFTDDPVELAAQIQRIDDRMLLMPSRVRSEKREVDDEF